MSPCRRRMSPGAGDDSGSSLIEVLAARAIMAVLMAAFTPVYVRVTTSTREFAA